MIIAYVAVKLHFNENQSKFFCRIKHHHAWPIQDYNSWYQPVIPRVHYSHDIRRTKVKIDARVRVKITVWVIG